MFSKLTPFEIRAEIVARRLYRKYRHATMIHPRDFRANIKVARSVLTKTSLTGAAIVECGTWRGGMSAALCEIGGPDRIYHFFDSFEGLPRAEDIDGKRAAQYQQDTSSPFYFDNCTASLEEFTQTLALSGTPNSSITIHKGWFEDTLRNFESPPICVLRLDGDWYDSTMTCLRALWPHVLPGGAVLIDDYYVWEGCSKAVHDFLSSIKATERIMQKANLAVIFKN
jgi:O-methyltransferase